MLARTGKSRLPAIRTTAASLACGFVLSACSYGSNPPLVCVPIKANVADKDGGVSSNSLSVLGQFEVDAQAAGPKVGLGKFFATGLAADKLADGFSAKLSK